VAPKQQNEASTDDVAELLDTVDKTLERLKTLYEQYFLGIQKQPPTYIHSDVERKLRDLTQMQLRNTGLRYRLATIQQKFGSYNSYWRRTLRQIENGTYLRNLSKIGREAIRTGAEIPDEILAAMPKRMREQVLRDREQAIAIARRRSKPTTSSNLLPPEPTDDVIAMIKEPTDLRRSLKTQNGRLVLDESDGELDIDAFFEAVRSGTIPPPLGSANVEKLASPAATAALRPASGLQSPASGPKSPASGPQSPASGPKSPASGPQSPAAGRPGPPPPPGVPRAGTSAQAAIPRAPTADPTRATGAQPAVAKPADPTYATGPQPAIPRPATGGQPVVAKPTTGGLPPVPKPPTAIPPIPPLRPATGESAAVPRPMAASQASRPNPIAPGSAAVHGPVPVESMAGPFPREPRERLATPVQGVPAIPSNRTPAQGVPVVNPAAPPPPVASRMTPAHGVPAMPRRATPAQGVPVQAAPPMQSGPTKRPPAPVPQRPPPGMTDADVNALYANYVRAKEMVGEKIGPGEHSKLLKTINQQAPKIMEQYKAKGVDFSVVVKDNQVIIRAKPKP
jgi:hypothetical protein